MDSCPQSFKDWRVINGFVYIADTRIIADTNPLITHIFRVFSCIFVYGHELIVCPQCVTFYFSKYMYKYDTFQTHEQFVSIHENVCNQWIRVHSHLWTSSITGKKQSNTIVKQSQKKRKQTNRLWMCVQYVCFFLHFKKTGLWTRDILFFEMTSEVIDMGWLRLVGSLK